MAPSVSLEALDRKRIAVGAREWTALYPQRPAPEDGDYFKAEWIRECDILPAKETMRIYGASDYAVTANGGDYTVHVVLGIDQGAACTFWICGASKRHLMFG
jgi:hypothetical protein